MALSLIRRLRRCLPGLGCALAALSVGSVAAAPVIAQRPAGAAEARLTVRAGDQRVPETAVQSVTQMARRGLDRLGAMIPVSAPRPIELWVHVDPTSLDVEHPAPSEQTAGFALLGRDEAHVFLERARSAPPNDLRTVVEHELCHVLLDQWAGSASPFVPRWFHEGLAQELTEAAYVDTKEVDLAILANTDRLIPFYLLRRRFPSGSERLTRISYAQSLSFVSFLRRRVGLEPLLEAVRHCGTDRALGKPFYDVVGRPLVHYEQRWRDEVSQHALLRLLRENCFSILLILSLPLLILAGMQRWRREQVRRDRLAAEDRAWAEAMRAGDGSRLGEERPQ